METPERNNLLTENIESTTPGANTPLISEERTTANNLEQSLTASADEVGMAKERATFIEFHAQNPGQVPANFKTAGDYYDSLMNAQKAYTQGQQQIAELKSQIASQEVDGNVNPNYVAPPAQPAVEQPVVTGTEELRIPTPEPEPEIQPGAFSTEDWAQIQTEVATSGSLSEQTKQLIQKKTGAPMEVIESIEQGQKSILKDAFKEAAEKVGSQERLAAIFEWAQNNLTPEQQAAVNQNLSNKGMYETTLYGLAHQYDTAMANVPTANEPAPTPNLETATDATPVVGPYLTKREFVADKNNPRYRTDPQFRAFVDQRTIQTNWSTLPA